ncbi:MAG: DoxX family protein [Polaribacter sp.]
MTTQKKSKGLHIGLWIAQGLLAIMFIMAGLTKATQPIEELAESLPWVTDTSAGLVKFIGISELLGGLGLLIPSIFRFKPQLTVFAALGLAIVMVLAAGFHASRGEYAAIGANVVFILIALFIAWGRSKKAPILAK